MKLLLRIHPLMKLLRALVYDIAQTIKPASGTSSD